MNKKFWAVIAVIAVVFVAFLWFAGKKNSGQNGGTQVQATNHVEGNLSSKVTLVEYGDFQCPVCGAYYPVVKQLYDKYQSTVKFQFRNLPLSQIHPNAFAAARAAEAASNQGKFWQMYDMLYSNQSAWAEGSASSAQNYFNQYAQQLGLDMAKFQTDFASDGVNTAINNDITTFKNTGNTMATPTFFLNGKKLDLKTLVDGTTGQPQLSLFSKQLDVALKQK